MDELLEGLSRVDLRPSTMSDPRAGIHGLLARAFSRDLRYLGAYRAWQEAVLSDQNMAKKQKDIQAWTTACVTSLFQLLQKIPGARRGVDIRGLARAMENFFWSLLSQAAHSSRPQLNQQIDAATHMIYHALFTEHAGKTQIDED
jgi:hypothetical protein